MSNLFNPSYLKQLCLKYGLVPSKKYGQNFLINEEPIEKMLEAAELTRNDAVVEVGPGFGVLTFALAEKVAKVMAFEIERKLKQYWDGILSNREVSVNLAPCAKGYDFLDRGLSPIAQKVISLGVARKEGRSVDIKNIEIVWGNVLKELKVIKLKSYKVIANLPYQITSNVIRYFLEAENKPGLMILMVQKEVAERICAKPGEMSILSVAVQYYARPEIIMNVPRAYFWPEPNVDSAVIKLSLRAPRSLAFARDKLRNPMGVRLSSIKGIASVAEFTLSKTNVLPRNDSKIFFKIVKAGFANRRKLLVKNLETIVGKKNRGELEKIFVRLSLALTVRAQELSVQKWQELTGELSTLSLGCE